MEIKPHTRLFEQHKAMPAGIAYRMLGSLNDAEDIVQETYIRWRGVKLSRVESSRAYLASIATRLCIDKLRKSNADRLLYTGPWLPEPVDEYWAGQLTSPETAYENTQSISMAFLCLLETLRPQERAVFILREAFDIGHDQIANMLDIRTAHARQLYRRAKSKINDSNEKAASQSAQTIEHQALLEKFIAAANTGNLDERQKLMTLDIIAYSDGGGRASAAIIPLVGIDRVSTVLLHLMKQPSLNWQYSLREINGEIGLVIFDGQVIHSTHCFAMSNGKINRIYTMRNPGKLNNFSAHPQPIH